MANCTVSGTFTNPQGSAISGATVRFNVQTPLLDASGNLVMPKEITTTTATDGTWSLSIIQAVAGILTLDLSPASTAPTVKYKFSMVIPSTTTATFASCWVDSGSFGGQGTTNPLTFAGIAGTLATAQLPALASSDIWIGNGSSLATALPLSGDVSLANTGATTVITVGGSTAANVHAGEVLANAATDTNTASALVKRDASGNFSAGTISAALSGNATTATTATSFSGSLTGDVTGTQASTTVTAIRGSTVASTTPTDTQLLVYNSTQNKYNPVSLSGDVTATNTGATTVGSVGGSTSALVHSAELLANAATDANTASAIVKRDGSGNFTAGTITAALTGTASGNTTYSANNHGLVVSSATNAMTVVAPDASTTKVLVSGGSSANPAWSLLTNSNLSGSAGVTNANLATMTTGTAKANISGSTATPSDVTLTASNTNSSIVLRDGSGNFSAGTITATLSGNASTVTTNANLTGDVTSVGNATTYAGTVPLNKGGTGQTTKAAAFDALSPMSASGDIVYGGASGTGTRLAKGSDGNVLTLASGIPSWAALSSVNVSIYGTLTYPGTASNTWTVTNTAFADFGADSNASAPTVTGSCAAPATKVPEVDCTSMPDGTYMIIAQFEGGAQGASAQTAWRLTDGTTVFDTKASGFDTSASVRYPINLIGIMTTTGTATHNFKIQGCADSGQNRIYNSTNGTIPQTAAQLRFIIIRLF